MCGIFGFIAKPGTPGMTHHQVREASQHLRPRGPDDDGFYAEHGGRTSTGRIHSLPQDDQFSVVLLHRRLSILDLSTAGWQPFTDRSSGQFLVYNGEIYNHGELRDELKSLGHRFDTTCDTEVLFRALQTWGPEALVRVQGMYGFGFLDTRRRTLLLARDPLSIKPLYLRTTGNNIAFSSQLTTLMQLDPQGNPIDAGVLLGYLKWGRPNLGNRTLVLGIKRFNPGTYSVYSTEDCSLLSSGSTFSPSFRSDLLSPREAAAQIRSSLHHSVRQHLQSDVPVGLALSGGVDSTGLAAMMRDCDPDSRFWAFSFFSSDNRVSEERLIRDSANRYRLNLVPVRLSPSAFQERSIEMCDRLDEPFGSTSALAEYLVFEAARKEGVPVVLSGQGPDEMFGGYPKYRLAACADAFKRRDLRLATQRLRGLQTYPDTSGAMGVFGMARYLLPNVLANAGRQFIGRGLIPAGCNRRYFEDQAVVEDYMKGRTTERGRPGILGALQWTETFEVGLPGLLALADTTSMAHSIEARVPYVTMEFAKLSLAISDDAMVSMEGETKHALRVALRDLVSPEILGVRRKIGFETEEQAWLPALSTPLAEMLREQPLPFLDPKGVIGEIDRLGASTRFHWRLFALLRWAHHNSIQF